MFANIDLSSIGAAGITIHGSDMGDFSGYSVSGAGDVNGDGYEDLIIGAYRAAAGSNLKDKAGESYLIFGGPTSSGTIDLANLVTGGVRIFGAEANDYSGGSVSGGGDVNGDGFDDLIIGAIGGDGLGNSKPYAGESYIVFGKAVFPSSIDLSSLGIAGVTIFGSSAQDYSGIDVSSVGDINGDGFDDLAIGATGGDASADTKLNAGDSYILFGKAAWPTTMSLASLGSAGVTFYGADINDQSGSSVNSAGDVNGDGFDDLLIGAYTADAASNLRTDAGESYLIFGAAFLPTSMNLSSLGTAGVTIFGAEAGDQSGVSVSGVGDIDGDGFDDIVIGARYADSSSNGKLSAGESYVVFGGASLPATIDLAILGDDGVTILGADASDNSGIVVSRAGDVNGDGFDDLLVGAYKADAEANAKADAGESYLIYGSSSLLATIDLANLGADGIAIFGADATDQSGFSVSGVGDLNGDGFDDWIVGANLADAAMNGKPDAGESYLIFGGDFTAAVTQTGTDASDTLTGTSAADVMVGGRGNDALVGNGDTDILIGGQGDDVLAMSDLLFQRVVGGTGLDTLRLDGSGHSLDLLAIGNNRILGIEQIDITGSGNNAISVAYREVLNISDESNVLVVRRNLGDEVNIGAGWTQGSNQNIGGVDFAVYTQGRATLKVQRVGATIVNRQVFYNRSTSSIFGDGTGNPQNAIDPTKSALLPGQTTTFANYTNYSRGLNGIVVDVANLPGPLTPADFQFETWDGILPAGFAATTAIPTIAILSGAGVGGSSRIKIEFVDHAIRNAWLRVTILASVNTGLVDNDVFYFGNAVAEMNSGNTGTPITLRTNATDTSVVRQNQSTPINSVGIANIYDVNKDGRVNATDTSIVRQNQLNSIIRFFTAPTSLTLPSGSIDIAPLSSSAPTFDSFIVDWNSRDHSKDSIDIFSRGQNRMHRLQLHEAMDEFYIALGRR